MKRVSWVVLAVVCVVLGGAASVLVAAQPGLPVRPAGPNATDIGFSQDMSVHHTQALLMANIVLERPGASAPVRALAAQIELAQAEEIGVFRGWLRLWDAPGVSSAPMSWMKTAICSAADRSGRSPMPGLATEPELEALRTAEGAALDRQFLRLMLYHHIGGIDMIRAAIVGSAIPQVRTLAREMLFEESEEIGYINQIRRMEHFADPIGLGGR